MGHPMHPRSARPAGRSDWGLSQLGAEIEKRTLRRKAAVRFAGAALYAMLFALGSQIDQSGATQPMATAVRFCLAYPLALAALWILLDVRMPERKARGEAASLAPAKPFCAFGAFCLIFCCYVPMFLIEYPGSFTYDTQTQTLQIASGEYDMFHPLVHTLLLRMCLSAYPIFQSFERCALLYTLIQMTLVSACFARSCASLSRSCSRRAACLAVAFFCLFPYHMVFASNCTKDVLFSAFFALFMTRCLEAVRGKRVSFRLGAELTISGALACLLRNNMIYALAVWLLVLLLCGRGMRRIGLCALLAAVLCLGVNEGLCRLTGTARGNVREMLCVPMQQLSRAWRDAPQSFTGQEREAMDAFFLDQGYLRYDPTLADPVKYTFNTEAFEEDPMRFARLWLSVGVKCPAVYLDAFLNTALPFLYPYETYHSSALYIETGLNSGVLTEPFGQEPIVQPGRFRTLRAYLDQNIWSTGAAGIPLLRWVFNAGLTIWLMLFFVLRAMYAGDGKHLAMLLLPLLLWGTYLLGPVMQGRYLYPFICTLPVFFARPAAGEGRGDHRKKNKEELDHGI